MTEAISYIQAVEKLAWSIHDFHERFDCEFGDPFSRHLLLDEEMGEVAKDINRGNDDAALEELADVVFVALGTLELARHEGIMALLNVAIKNDAKTNETHARNARTGKIERRRQT